jgi:uncharacterized protein YdeI (BOF family)
MKLQNRAKLEVVALEARQLLSTMIAESEPNNTRVAADVVTIGQTDGTAIVTGTISGRKDQDVFQFSAESSGTVNLSCTANHRSGCRVSVQDSEGRELFETQPNDGIKSGTFTVEAGQTVFVRVRGHRHRGGDYSIQMTLSPSTPVVRNAETNAGVSEANSHLTAPSAVRAETGTQNIETRTDEPANNITETEPNDSPASANQFDLGSDGVIRLEGSAVDDGDVDFFAFTPATSGTLNIAVQANRAVSATLEIETATGVKLFETDPNNGFNSGSLDVTAGETYFIRLSSPVHPSAPYVVDLALL